MLDHRAVAELVRRVLDVRQSVPRTHLLVEMDCELAKRFAFLRVDLILEVDQEALQVVNVVACSYIADVDTRLEDGSLVRLKTNLVNALVDQISYLAAHDRGDFTTLAPKDIGGAFLALLAVAAHVEVEVLVDKKADESTLGSRKTGIGF